MAVVIVLSILVAVFGIVGLVGGGFLGYAYRTRIHTASLVAAEKASAKQLENAEQRRKQILARSNQEAKRETLKVRERAHKEIQRDYNRLREKENKLEQRADGVERRLKNLNQRESRLNAQTKDLEHQAQTVERKRQEYVQQLESIANISAEEARKSVLEQVDQEIEATLGKRYANAETIAREHADGQARFILAETIQRMASSVVSDVSVTSLELPDEDTKGRLIGREGRNIKAIEKATGVDLMMDETPGMVVLSSFDPMRREIARLSIEQLMRDGRIQPVRIENTVAKVKKDMAEKVRKIGKDASYEVDIKRALPNELLSLMGQLKYRTSYGSNVLQHSIEVGTLAGVLAAEIGADVNICRVGGFLHDVGKALTPEVKGAHAEIGADLVAKHNFDERIVTAIREHHDRQMTTTESFIVAAADAISAARPGARRESAEKYIERMKELENIARNFEGVDNCYALQSGHELRVLVNPNGINDKQFGKLANDIVAKIEDQFKFPGEINVTLIRESRITKVAR